MAKIIMCDACGKRVPDDSKTRSMHLSINKDKYTRIKVFVALEVDVQNAYPPFDRNSGDICMMCLGQALIDSARGVT